MGTRLCLTRIELVGFKSFAHRTVCSFGPGISAVVGPNGCGKSNIVEAVRWVLGEQRPSMVRGKTMGDLIFSGSPALGPMSMAQVTLVWDNTGRQLPFDADEVCLGRRVYADGEAKYLLNGRPCMLRELREVLYNSGLGAPEYVVMQREMVDQVLSNRAWERRVLIEEAAGITGYKSHVKQALARLEQVQNSLLRLQDILAERQRQVERLSHEAARARRARKWRERMEALLRAKALMVAKACLDETVGLRQEVARLAERWELARADVAAAEAKAQGARLALAQVDEAVAEASGRLAREREALTSWLAKSEAARDRLADLVREVQRLEGEWEEAKERLGQLNQLVAREEDQWQRMDREAQEATTALTSAELCHREAAEAVASLHRQVGAVQREVEQAQAAAREAARVRDRCELEVRHLTEALEARDRRMEAMRQAHQECLARLEGLEEELASLQAARERHSEVEALMARKVQRLESLVARAEESYRTCALRVQDIVTRLQVLEQMCEAREGFSGGSRFVMEQKPEGILGLLGEEITVRSGFERAAEAALGEAVDSVVVGHREAARRLLAMVSHAQPGRVRIAELDLVAARNGRPPRPVEAEGIVGPLLDFVGTSEGMRPVLASLLGKTLVVRALPPDGEVQRLWDLGWDQVVTLAGEVMRADGMHEAGAGAHGVRLGRRREMEELGTRLHGERRRLGVWEARLEHLKDLLSRVRHQVHQLALEERELSLRQSRCEADHETVRAERDKMRDALGELAHAQTKARERLGKLQEQREAADLQARHLAEACQEGVRRREELFAQVERAEARLRDLEEARVKALQRAHQARADAASARARLESLAEQVRREEERATALAERLAVLRDEVRLHQQVAQEAQRQVEALRRRCHEAEGLLDQVRGARQTEASRVATLEAAAREARARAQEAQEALHARELSLAAAESKLGEAMRAVRELGLQGEDVSAYRSPMDLAQLERLLAEVGKRLASVGEVNVRAEEEYRHEAQSLEELSRQVEDVRRSRDELIRSVEKANAVARERFATTLERVNAHFQETYAMLVPGGRARLELRGDGPLVDRDIDLVVQPAGKRSRPVELLSGGERALVALAFLFAVYREKPGPLCILDEVDAPLDDANTSRFMDMVENLASSTQFIIVTHNKHTMTRAHRLIGVTMEQGISRVVPVELGGSS